MSCKLQHSGHNGQLAKASIFIRPNRGHLPFPNIVFLACKFCGPSILRKSVKTHTEKQFLLKKASDNIIPGCFLMDKKLISFILLFLIHRQNIRVCQCRVNWQFPGSNSAHSCMKTNMHIHLIGIYISVTKWRNCLVNSKLTLVLWKFRTQKRCLNRQF